MRPDLGWHITSWCWWWGRSEWQPWRSRLQRSVTHLESIGQQPVHPCLHFSHISCPYTIFSGLCADVHRVSIHLQSKYLQGWNDLCMENTSFNLSKKFVTVVRPSGVASGGSRWDNLASAASFWKRQFNLWTPAKLVFAHFGGIVCFLEIHHDHRPCSFLNSVVLRSRYRRAAFSRDVTSISSAGSTIIDLLWR